MPLVSVVVIGYNDAQHLPMAIRSVQRQTFRDIEILVVDDASTDSTPQVAQRLAEQDGRIRLLRLDQNSGGCSRPRNVGVDAATGRYVLFLDSDDELPRRAVARLVAAAQGADADLACGRWVRRHHHPRRVIPAHEELYARARVVASIADEPRLLYDSPAWNKLYRRTLITDNGLRFPEGMLYEDLLFTTEAFCAANRIALVPDVVYIWHVRRQATSLSITNRGDTRAWRDRLEAHRRIDAFLAEHKLGAALIEAKQRKFVELDFVLFLRDLRQASAADRPDLFALATAYIAALPQPLSTSPALHDAFDATARADLDSALAAADRVVAGDDRYGVVQRVSVGSQARVTVEGSVAEETPPTSARLELRGRLGNRLADVPAAVEPGDNGFRFRAELDLRRLGRRLLTPRTGPEVRVLLTLATADGAATLPLIARDADLPADDAHAPTPWQPVTGDRLRFTERNGRFVAELSGLPRMTDTAIDLAGRAGRAARRLRRRAGQTSRSESAS
jgi:glycosyltransferase involved in cell wall biosynthesis